MRPRQASGLVIGTVLVAVVAAVVLLIEIAPQDGLAPAAYRPAGVGWPAP